ncbi:MAG: DUF2029 domain-containing protein [Bacteroidales bacterium]|nr:DUF2029 domain-containing protein [Bacteroidales bacterium]
MKIPINNKTTLSFIVFSFLFFLAFFILQNINHRFQLHDFKVYYLASNAFLYGDQVYNIPHGLSTDFFKYSPFSLFLFIPVSLLPFAWAKILHFILLCGFISFTIIYITGFVRSHFYPGLSLKVQKKAQFLLMLICILQFYFELHLGNVNIILLLIVLTALTSILNNNQGISGILLAIAVLLKPHFLLLLPLLLLRKKYHTILYFSISIISGLLFPTLFIGLSKNIFLHQEWFTTMMNHNETMIEGLDTVYSLIYRVLSQVVQFKPGALFSMIIFAVIYVGFCLMVLKNILAEKSKTLTVTGENNFIFEYFVILALIPNLTITDFEHFMFSLPLIAFIVMQLFNTKNQVLLLLVSIIAFFLYGGNLRDIVGARLSAWMTANGMLGLGNLIIIGISFVIYFYLRRKDTITTSTAEQYN